MTSEQVRLFMHQRPFRPFTIHIADGTVLGVRHPEFVTLNPSGRTMWVLGQLGDDRVIDLLLVTQLRYMTEAEMRPISTTR